MLSTTEADPQHTLHTRVGGPAVMRRQLLRLVEVSRLPNVTVQVHPFEAGVYAARNRSFVIFGGGVPELDTVYLEHPTKSLFLWDGAQLDEYARKRSTPHKACFRPGPLAAHAKYRPPPPTDAPMRRRKDTTVALPRTDDQPEALKPALGSMTVLVAAVIVHDRAAGRVVLLQRGENAKFARGKWDLPVGKSEPGEPITETAVRELHEETGLTVKSEALEVAHIIHAARGVEAPAASSPSSSPPTNGRANPRTASRASTPKSCGSTPTPSPGSS